MVLRASRTALVLPPLFFVFGLSYHCCRCLEPHLTMPGEAGLPGSTLDSEDDADFCRICRCAAELDDPLFFPCKCSGSIRSVISELTEPPDAGNPWRFLSRFSC